MRKHLIDILRQIFRSKIPVIVVTILIVFTIFEVVFIRIPTYIKLKQLEEEIEFQSDIRDEILKLESELLRNSEAIYIALVNYFNDNYIEFSEDREEYTEDEIQCMIMHEYFVQNFSSTKNWTDYDWNSQISVMIVLFEDYLRKDSYFENIIERRETIYAIINELEIIIQED